MPYDSAPVRQTAPTAQPLRELPGTRDDRYRLTTALVHTFDRQAFALAALGLLHGLVHRVCRDNPEWTRGYYMQPEDGDRCRCRDLREPLGLLHANDNQAFRSAIPELLKTGWFEDLRLLHGNTFLQWRFRQEFLDALFADEGYGLLDIRAVGDLRSTMAIALYAHICCYRRLANPQIYVQVEFLCDLLGPGKRSWARASGPFLKSLQAIAKRENITFLCSPLSDGRLRGIDTLHLRMLHAGTRWSAKRVGQFETDASSLIIIMPDGKKMRLDSRALGTEDPARLLKIQRARS